MGDLLANGSIRWTDTKQIFSTPSSWVNHCKKIVNPDNSGKTGSAWSTIRYNGKRLDSYKLRWYRRQKKIINNASMLESAMGFNPAKLPHGDLQASNLFKELQFPLPVANNNALNDDPVKLKQRNIVEHASLGLRTQTEQQDPNVMVKCTPFSAVDRIQPFTMTVSTNCLVSSFKSAAVVVLRIELSLCRNSSD